MYCMVWHAEPDHNHKWESDSQSSKKLKVLKGLVKSSDFGLELSSGGRAAIYFNVDAVLRVVLHSKRT